MSAAKIGQRFVVGIVKPARRTGMRLANSSLIES